MGRRVRVTLSSVPWLDGEDLGPALAGDHHRADLLEIAVDPGRPGHQVEQLEAGNGRRTAVLAVSLCSSVLLSVGVWQQYP